MRLLVTLLKLFSRMGHKLVGPARCRAGP